MFCRRQQERGARKWLCFYKKKERNKKKQGGHANKQGETLQLKKNIKTKCSEKGFEALIRGFSDVLLWWYITEVS